MSINASTLSPAARPSLRLIDGGSKGDGSTPWWERRAQLRALVGGCPDHWWNPTSRRTGACTCDRY